MVSKSNAKSRNQLVSDFSDFKGRYTIFLQIPSNNFFQSMDFFFSREISSRRLRGARLPMSLGSFASFRRIVPSRDTSTMESEIPSFRDAKPHEPCLGTCSLRRIVPFRDTSTTESEIPSFRDAQPKQSVLAPRHCEERSDVAILSAGKDCFYTSSITPLR